jgi:hypothetical protein
VTSALLSANYFLFSFSRLAFLELLVTLFVVASLWVLINWERTNPIVAALFAGVLVALGILTKSVGVFALPLIAYASWRRGSSPRQRAALAALCVLTPVLTVGLFNVVAELRFPADYFVDVASTLHVNTTLRGVLKTLWGLATAPMGGHAFYALTIAATASALAVSARYRANPGVHLALLWIAVLLVVLSVKDYSPPRYFVSFIVPLALLCGTAIIELHRRLFSPVLSVVPLLLVAGLLGREGVKIAESMREPRFSYVSMARAVRTIIDADASTAGVFVIGHTADFLALETGVRALNSWIATEPFESRLRTYRPRYYLSHTDAQLIEVMRRYAEVVPLGDWEVMGNYYDHRSMQLFRLDYRQTASRETESR